jgi:hypothetical protein
VYLLTVLCAVPCCALCCVLLCADEVLDGDNCYACDGCKQRCRANRRCVQQPLSSRHLSTAATGQMHSCLV